LPRHVSATASSGTVTGWSKREARNVGRCPEKTDSSVSQKKYIQVQHVYNMYIYMFTVYSMYYIHV
jgi:hypothetical protein